MPGPRGVVVRPSLRDGRLHNRRVGETTEQRRVAWSERFARRARGEAGTAIAQIMALASRTDVVSFAGGFPDPAVIDREALTTILREIGFTGVLSLELFNPTYWKQDPLTVAKTGLEKMKRVAARVAS